MRSVNSAFWRGLQNDTVNLCELIELETPSGTYRWTTSNVPIVSSGSTYDPFPGGAGSGAEESTDLGVGVMDFTIINSGNLKTMMNANALDFANVSISRVFVNSPNLGRLFVFRGRVADLTYTRDTFTGQVRDMFNGVTGRFPYGSYKDRCDWRFGSAGCGVNVSSYTVATSISPASSNPLVLMAAAGTIAQSYAPGRLEKGRFTALSGANSGQARSIRSNTGDLLWLSHALPYSVSSGLSFQVAPGCRKRIIEDCTSLYNNQTRAMAFPWIPKTEQAFS